MFRHLNLYRRYIVYLTTHMSVDRNRRQIVITVRTLVHIVHFNVVWTCFHLQCMAWMTFLPSWFAPFRAAQTACLALG